MNLGELKARVRDALQAETTDLRYTDAKIGQVLNEGNQDMVVRSGCLISTGTITTVAYQYQYALPSVCVDILRFYETEDVKRKVWPLTVRHLDDTRREWRDHTGTYLEWYFRFSVELLFVGPRPATSGTDYTITYTTDPGLASMTADTHEPDMPIRHREPLVDYAVARLLLEGGRGEETAKRALAKMQTYDAGVKRLRDQVFRTHDRMNRFDQGWPTMADYGVPA